MKLFLLVSLFAYQSSLANPLWNRASQRNSVIYKELATRVIEGLLKKNINRIGSHSVPQIGSDILKKVQWGESWAFLKGSGGVRSCGFYLKNIAILNIHCTNNLSRETHPVLLLHEALGALGCYDENYEVSLSFWGTDKFPHLRSFFDKFAKIKYQKCVPRDRKYKNRCELSGGIDSFGGGGDGFAIELKMLMIERVLSSQLVRNRQLNTLKSILNQNIGVSGKLDFESANNPKVFFQNDCMGNKQLVMDRMFLHQDITTKKEQAESVLRVMGVHLK